MTRRTIVALSLTAALVAPATTHAQSHQTRGKATTGQPSGGGKATPRSGGGSGSSGGTTSTRSGPSPRAGGASGTDAGESSRPVRGTSRRSGESPGGSVQAGGSSGGGTAVTRDRDLDPARGRAVPRQPGTGSGSGGGPTVIVANPGYWGGYYPWGYAGLGVGGYYGGLYDPWWYDGGGYGGDPGNDYYGYTGSLRLKIKPRDAEVYVDGYFAGQVDDFDGVFQRLKIESGPHRVEVREEGFEPLMFEIQVQPDRTVTYKGDLKALP